MVEIAARKRHVGRSVPNLNVSAIYGLQIFFSKQKIKTNSAILSCAGVGRPSHLHCILTKLGGGGGSGGGGSSSSVFSLLPWGKPQPALGTAWI